MNKNIFIVLTCIAIYATSLSMGPSKKQKDQAIVQNIIADLKRTKNEKLAAAIQENAYAIIPALENLTDDEKAIALSEIDSLVPAVKKSQQEQKKEAGAMPAAPGGPGSQPKKVVQQKPMSEARKEARRIAAEMQRGAILSGVPTAEMIAEERNSMMPGEAEGADKALFKKLSDSPVLRIGGLPHQRVGATLYASLEHGASPNALIITDKKISVPAFWGLIDRLHHKIDTHTFHEGMLILHRFRADFDARASDDTPILNYLIKYWPKLENGDIEIEGDDGRNRIFRSVDLQAHLGEAIASLMHFGAELNAVDANGDTFLDILLKRIDDPFITGKGKEVLDIIIKNLAHNSQRQELRDMIAEYKKEHVQPLREQMRQPAQQEVIQQPGIRNIVEGYLFGEKE